MKTYVVYEWGGEDVIHHTFEAESFGEAAKKYREAFGEGPGKICVAEYEGREVMKMEA
jgi:hypothetical protein